MSCRYRMSIQPLPFNLKSRKSWALEPECSANLSFLSGNAHTSENCLVLGSHPSLSRKPKSFSSYLSGMSHVKFSMDRQGMMKPLLQHWYVKKIINYILDTFSRLYWSLRMKLCGFRSKFFSFGFDYLFCKWGVLASLCAVSKKPDYFGQRGGCCAKLMVDLIANKQGSDSA